jgi:hypothetical protein
MEKKRGERRKETENSKGEMEKWRKREKRGKRREE